MDPISLTRIFGEARRRRLFGVLALYIIGAWIVLQSVALAMPGWDIPDSAIRHVWIGAILLFPVAVVFGWFYDVSARGITRTAPADAGVASLPLARPDYGVLALFALITGSVLLTVTNQVLDSRGQPVAESVAREIPLNSIAVLPFVNMSDDEENDYFSDGISEELLNELTRMPGLHVAARKSSFYYKEKNEPVQTMGQELGVRMLLEGSVRKVGNSVRITAQLIDAGNGYHLWSNNYDRKLDDIFMIQTEIAGAIADVLKIELGAGDEARRDRFATDNVEAYDLYLRGMNLRRVSTEDWLNRSNEFMQRAIELEPDFALAHDALGYGYLLKSYDGSMTIDDAVAAAAPLIQRALELQPDLEDAHASLGLLNSRIGNFPEADQHYETALAMNPNFIGAHINYGLNLVIQSRLKEASAAYLRAQVLDPINADLSFNLGALLMLMGQFEQGAQFMGRALEIRPGSGYVRAAMTHWLGVYGRLDKAITTGRRILAAEPDNWVNIGALVSAYISIGMLDEAEETITGAQMAMPDNQRIRDKMVDVLLARSDTAAFIELASVDFAIVDAEIGDPLGASDRDRAYRYGLALLIQEEYQAAADVFYWVAGGEDGIAATKYDLMVSLKMLALAYRHLDRVEESDELLDHCLQLVDGARENGWATPVLFVRLAEIHAIRGDADLAAATLETAFERGWRRVDVLDYGVFWREIRHEPQIEEVRLLVLNDLEAQRQRLEGGAADAAGS